VDDTRAVRFTHPSCIKPRRTTTPGLWRASSRRSIPSVRGARSCRAAGEDLDDDRHCRDIPIMRIQLLTGVSLLLLSPNSEPPPAAVRTIAFHLAPPPVVRSRWRRRVVGRPPRRRTDPFPGGHEATERGDDKALVC
jgi:hypothetical protein